MQCAFSVKNHVQTAREFHDLNIDFVVSGLFENNLTQLYTYISMQGWLLQGLLLLCNKKLKNSKFSKRLEAASIECDFYKIRF